MCVSWFFGQKMNESEKKILRALTNKQKTVQCIHKKNRFAFKNARTCEIHVLFTVHLTSIRINNRLNGINLVNFGLNGDKKSKARIKSSPKLSCFVYKIFWLNKKSSVFIQFRPSHTDNTACYTGFAAQNYYKRNVKRHKHTHTWQLMSLTFRYKIHLVLPSNWAFRLIFIMKIAFSIW